VAIATFIVAAPPFNEKGVWQVPGRVRPPSTALNIDVLTPIAILSFASRSN